MAEWKIEADAERTMILYVGPYEPGIIQRLIGLVEDDDEYDDEYDLTDVGAAIAKKMKNND